MTGPRKPEHYNMVHATIREHPGRTASELSRLITGSWRSLTSREVAQGCRVMEQENRIHSVRIKNANRKKYYPGEAPEGTRTQEA